MYTSHIINVCFIVIVLVRIPMLNLDSDDYRYICTLFEMGKETLITIGIKISQELHTLVV